ncbi:DoxX family protein [Janibacter cremeus]|uniref:Putative membrane protein n=1 Tax=Janibacter cremeus TaxID=1285192 RepID=A0A852VMJ6_9MICO|nr:DoxX family protein [Janibacter cremeus]NYF97149.1 putative membrane protein [Janibacter cremeus]
MTRPDLPTTLLASAFAASGVIHLVRPQVFQPIVPSPLRDHDRALVHASGVAEIACAAGLLISPTRPAAGLASAALLVAVFPANVQMSIDHARRARRGQTPQAWSSFAGTLARLPLQWPLVRIALRAAGRG